MNDEEFYVGYATRAAAGLKRTIIAVIVALNALSVVLAVALVLGQRPFAAAAFEFGRFRDLEGIIREHPYPSLLVARPGVPAGALPFSCYLLVASGKHGATATVSGLNGMKVRLRGALIYRGEATMIELEPGFVPLSQGSVPGPAHTPLDLGEVTLAGEIVDSKCYFGVMNPGGGKVHRDCAVRCISGGIPPVFVVKDAEGRSKTILLAGADGHRLNREVLDFVAEPLAIRGRLTQSGESYVLWADPGSFFRR